MPFKTRKQKLSAVQRRYTMAENILVNYKSNPRDSVSHKDGELEKKSPISIKVIEENYGYVKLDLLKTLILAGIIIAIQFFLLLKIYCLKEVINIWLQCTVLNAAKRETTPTHKKSQGKMVRQQ